MDAIQKRKYNAGASGDHAMTLHAADFSTDTPLKDLQTDLQGILVNIADDAQKQQRNTGYASQLVTDLNKMDNAAWAMSKLEVEYAKKIVDPILQHKIDFSKTDFTHGAIADRTAHSKTVHDVVTTTVLSDMIAKGYKIDATKVSDLQSFIDKVLLDQGKPKDDIADVKSASTDLLVQLQKLKDVEESIDNLMVPYAESNSAFYNAVTDAFEPSAIGMRGIALRVVAVDSVTNTRIAGADVALDNGRTDKTSRRGISDFSHQVLPESNVAGTIKIKGYADGSFANQAVFNDRFTRLEIKMVKL